MKVQAVEYTKSTDLISPTGGQKTMRLDHSHYEIIEPVTGWAPYTHLIYIDPDHAYGYDLPFSGYYLAQFDAK